MDLKSCESLQRNISKAVKRHLFSSSMTCRARAEAHEFIQTWCHSSARLNAKTDGALRSRGNTERHRQASAAALLPDYFLERTVIILGESAELHAVCQHRPASRSYTSSHSCWQTTRGCCCQLQSCLIGQTGGHPPPSSEAWIVAEGRSVCFPSSQSFAKPSRIHTTYTLTRLLHFSPGQ